MKERQYVINAKAPRWTEDELRFLKNNSPRLSLVELAEIFGRTPKAVGGRANRMGITTRMLKDVG